MFTKQAAEHELNTIVTQILKFYLVDVVGFVCIQFHRMVILLRLLLYVFLA